MAPTEAKAIDHFGKGGGLVDGLLVREFPERRRMAEFRTSGLGVRLFRPPAEFSRPRRYPLM